MPDISWDEVATMGLTHLSNTDYTHTHFEGEVESIARAGNRVVIKCKWVRALEPTHHDEDGDPCYDGVQWKPHQKTELDFSLDDKPFKHHDGSAVTITCWLERYSTETRLSKKTEFESLKPRG